MNSFGDYTKPSVDGDALVDCFINQGKSNYRELSVLKVDAYDFEALKVLGKSENEPSDFRFNIINKMQKKDEKNMNEVSFKKEEGIKVLEYNMALWR